MLFAFASVTHFRPRRFDQLLTEPIGTFVVDFISRQPGQLLYLLASEIASREVVPGIGPAGVRAEAKNGTVSRARHLN